MGEQAASRLQRIEFYLRIAALLFVILASASVSLAAWSHSWGRWELRSGRGYAWIVHTRTGEAVFCVTAGTEGSRYLDCADLRGQVVPPKPVGRYSPDNPFAPPDSSRRRGPD
jgi:hypothetical protein